MVQGIDYGKFERMVIVKEFLPCACDGVYTCNKCEMKDVRLIHAQNCDCTDCVHREGERKIGYVESEKFQGMKSAFILEQEKREAAEAFERFQSMSLATAREQMEVDQEENKQKHLNHPFYQRVENVVNEVATEQIIKGSKKYQEPFNPESWTNQELLRHGLQEARDLQVYLVGLSEKLDRQDIRYDELMDKYEKLEKEHKGLINIYDLLEKEIEEHKNTIVELSLVMGIRSYDLMLEIKSLQEENEKHLEAKSIYEKSYNELNKEYEKLKEKLDAKVMFVSSGNEEEIYKLQSENEVLIGETKRLKEENASLRTRVRKQRR